MLQQDPQFFDGEENDTGSLASRVDSDAQSMFELMGYNVASVLVADVQLGAPGILAIAHNWNWSVAVALVGPPPMASSAWLKIHSDAKLDWHTSKRYSPSASIASEAVAAIRTVSSLAVERSVLDKYTLELDNAADGSTA